MHNFQLYILQVTHFVEDYLYMEKSHAKIQPKTNAINATRQHYVVISCRIYSQLGNTP